MAQRLDGIEDALLHTNDDRSSSSARSVTGERAKEWMGSGGGTTDHPEQPAINPPPLTSEMCSLWAPTDESHLPSGDFSDPGSPSRILARWYIYPPYGSIEKPDVCHFVSKSWHRAMRDPAPGHLLSGALVGRKAGSCHSLVNKKITQSRFCSAHPNLFRRRVAFRESNVQE